MGEANKATAEEKRQIKQRINDGAALQDVQAQFPHIDGRVISGMFRRYGAGGPARAHDAGSPPMPPVPPSPVPPPPGDPGQQPAGAQSPPAPPTSGEGFTPQASTAKQGMSGEGLKPSHREYFVIKKLDAPNEGVMKTEYPPFGINELLDRYPQGDYEIQHYLDGRLWRTYRDKVAQRGPSPNAPKVDAAAASTSNPADLFLKAMDIYHRMNHEGKREQDQAAAARVQIEASRENAKAATEATAIQTLAEVAKESMRAKPEAPKNDTEKMAVDKLITMMHEERKTAELRHGQEMERLATQAKLDLEKEKSRIDAEKQRFEKDLEHRQKMQMDFLGKMQELDKERQALWKESYEKMTGEISAMNQAMNEQWEERKKHLDDLANKDREHFKEIMDLQKNKTGVDKDVEVAKIIKDGITGGLDRIGTRIDSLVEHGVIKGAQDRRIINTSGREGDRKPDNANAKGKEEPKVAMKDLIADALKSEWFVDLKKEIYITVGKRIKIAGDASLSDKMKMVAKPHGSILAQSFIDQMNDDPRLRKFIGYLCSREWANVFADMESTLSEDEKKVFGHAEAADWWGQFQIFLTASWNQSIGIGS